MDPELIRSMKNNGDSEVMAQASSDVAGLTGVVRSECSTSCSGNRQPAHSRPDLVSFFMTWSAGTCDNRVSLTAATYRQVRQPALVQRAQRFCRFPGERRDVGSIADPIRSSRLVIALKQLNTGKGGRSCSTGHGKV